MSADRPKTFVGGYYDDKDFITSEEVARLFNRRHGSVLRSIRDLKCSNEFREENYAFIGEKAAGPVRRCFFNMTRDGYWFLCMSLTGKDAKEFKQRLGCEMGQYAEDNGFQLSLDDDLMPEFNAQRTPDWDDLEQRLIRIEAILDRVLKGGQQ